MKLKFFALLLSSLFILSCSQKAKAVYDPISHPNNKVGIHILEAGELEKAAPLVNSNEGSWGYVTIPIQPTDRNKEKWQQFMNQAHRLKIIPILRITTIPQGGTWAKAKDTDLVDFANFLQELSWPTQNHYVIIFNEVNRGGEWGGKVEPDKYAKILKNSSLIFKQKSQNFFILPAGLDNALPDSPNSLSSRKFLQQMLLEIPNIFTYIDGWTSHSYPNPGFSASPYKTGWQSITSYKQELAFIGKDLPIFITETGWDSSKISQTSLYNYYQIAWKKWLKNDQIIAITPFVLQGSGSPFETFSFLNQAGESKSNWQATEKLQKIKGEPLLSSSKQPNLEISQPSQELSPFNQNQPFFQNTNLLRQIEKILQKFLSIF